MVLVYVGNSGAVYSSASLSQDMMMGYGHDEREKVMMNLVHIADTFSISHRLMRQFHFSPIFPTADSPIMYVTITIPTLCGILVNATREMNTYRTQTAYRDHEEKWPRLGR